MVDVNNNNNDTILHIPVTAIKEDNQYSSLLFPIDEKEYETLKKDIADNGIKVPLIINSNNILLDGYTRLRIAKELQLDTVPCMVKHFNDPLEEELFILTVNAYRRHLNTAQKVDLALRVIELKSKIGKEKRMKNLVQYSNNNYDNNDSDNSDNGTAILSTENFPGKLSVIGSSMTNIGHDTAESIWKRIAKEFNVSEKTLAKGKKIKEVSGKDAKIAELWQEALQGKRSIQAVYERVKQKEARDNIKPLVNDAKMKLSTLFNGKIKILRGDFRQVLSDIPDNSIDLIFTDPPYSDNDIELVKELFLLTSRVLKPIGFLAVMYGQDHPDRFFQVFNNNNGTLRYYWCIALHLPDSNELLASKNVEIRWKPIILFQKEHYVRIDHRFKDYISEYKPIKALLT